ncbi:membrane protein-like protein [Chthoniobacter flavus Ellin428]|uniref:Membrane protein-like protein n=2 Tax=Chthoniobacter flavus TaxID=191863 RepID=B4CWR6_9BACT|nr:membrane protein-like protein [Chthoniobacter flavus Ellin428]TCO95782.1 putative membrane protein [Chthoniobacter flavus]
MEPWPTLASVSAIKTDHEKPQPKEEAPLLPGLTLEAFMGVKLFAWLGGLALFLGIVFFIRYSFEHNLITPQMRIAIGAITGLGLIAGGLRTPRPKYAVTAQTLCATGIVTLYSVTFGSYSFYHFIGNLPAFAIMAAITTAAFLLAVRMNAQVVAVLGLLGGFLTPVVLSTGQDNPVGLFSYLAALDLGLVAVALRQRWHYLVTLAAGMTGLTQLAWLGGFFAASKVATGTTIFLGFEALFLLPFWLCHRQETKEGWTAAGSAISAVAALIFAGHLLTFPTLGERPWICLSILLAADAGLAVWPLRNSTRMGGSFLGGAAAFFIISAWNLRYLNAPLLNWGLGYILVFAAFHTVLPLVVRKLRPTSRTPGWVQIFPLLALALLLWPAFHIGESFALWFVVLLIDLAVIALALLTASLLGLVGALVFTLIAAGLWLLQTPVENPQLGGLLTVIAGFAALFCGASVFLQGRLRAQMQAESADSLEADALNHLPAISAALPFVLLISTMLRLNPSNPSPIFAVGLLLVGVILGLTRWSRTVALPPVALVCAILLEYSWHAQTTLRLGWMPLGWSLGFSAVIFGFPFFFQSRKAAQATPWATAALAPVLNYPLIHSVVQNTWPHFWHAAGGLVPAALAIPPLAACDYLRRRIPAENPARLAILAWFGGVALLFITLIFPVQFGQEMLTLSWALEGAALLWLFHRVPHPGLRVVGFGLLCVAFARLALNPAVLAYHERSAIPVWNWYLYTYGVGAACFFAAARFTAAPRDRLSAISLPAVFYTCGTILLFLLLNIEIADYFSNGPTITFDFEGNLARDMTYSIAWSLFGLALLLVGMHRQVAGVRYAGIGLLAVTLAKLFLHDLASLDQLYRIGALIAVAIVLIGASYLYQRFFAAEEKAPPKAS